MRFIALAAAGLTLGACATAAPEPPAAAREAQARAAATEFLDAFNAMDAARFDSFFADDVTMFFPEGPFPQARVEGKAAVTEAFHRLFAMAKERGAGRLNIRPQELEVQVHPGLAVASFHLRGGGNIGRRSLVFRREGGRWLIVHFHASALAEKK